MRPEALHAAEQAIRAAASSVAADPRSAPTLAAHVVAAALAPVK